jgi:ketosteroid isomerase-like protein
MFCPNCGKEVQGGSKFCAYCGFRLVSEVEVPAQEVIRNVLIRRIEGIKNRDAKALEALVYKEKYTKFDDWPPFDLQGSEGLKNEAKALKVLKEYDYETRGWKIEVFGDSALAAFIVRYRGKIRDLSFKVQSRVTAFLTKHEGEWRIAHEHWSRFPQQPPILEQAEKNSIE